jgi:hypothetical protein
MQISVSTKCSVLKFLSVLWLILFLVSCGVTSNLEPIEEDDSLTSLAISVAYTKRYATNESDKLEGITTDGLGNVYIAGNSGGNGFLRKYDAAGIFLWQVDKTSASINGVTLDKNGNAYIVGSYSLGSYPNISNYIYLEKYDANGLFIWVKRFTDSVVGDPIIFIADSIATDPRGNNFIVILFEKSNYPYQYRQVFSRKYNVSGGLVWEKLITTTKSSLASPSLTTDKSGNTYVAVNTVSPLNAYNTLIAQLDTQGNYGWIARLQPTASSVFSQVNALSADKDGNVYITGFTNGALEGANLGSYDAFIRKLDTTGATLWTKQFGTSATDYANNLTTDDVGNVYIAGSSTGALQGLNRGYEDAFVRKYDANGNVSRTQQFGTSEVDIANFIKADTNGTLYVGGYTEGQFAGLPRGGTDVYFRKYSVFE